MAKIEGSSVSSEGHHFADSQSHHSARVKAFKQAYVQLQGQEFLGQLEAFEQYGVGIFNEEWSPLELDLLTGQVSPTTREVWEPLINRQLREQCLFVAILWARDVPLPTDLGDFAVLHRAEVEALKDEALERVYQEKHAA